MSTTTTNMGLQVPQLNDPSPGYVNNIASSLQSLDTHDHSTGKGTPITQSGILFSGPFSANGQSIVNLNGLRFQNVVQQPGPGDGGTLYMLGGDLYYWSPALASVRITAGGKIGGIIGGDYNSYPQAAINYIHSQLAYTFINGNGAPARGVFSTVQLNNTVGPILSLDPNTGLSVQDNAGNYANINLGTVARMAGAYIQFDTAGVQFNFKDTTNTLTKGNFGALATTGGINAVGGILQGSRIIALRGYGKSSSITGTSSIPITTYVDGATPGFSQATFTSPYAGSVAAIAARSYGATASAGTVVFATSGLSTNASTTSTSYTNVNSGFSQTFTPGVYTFSPGSAFTVNVNTSAWTQSTTGTVGVDVTLWVYA